MDKKQRKLTWMLASMVALVVSVSVSAQEIGYSYQGTGTAEAQGPTQLAACKNASNKARVAIRNKANIYAISHVLSGQSLGGCNCAEHKPHDPAYRWTCLVSYSYLLNPKN